jgi:hypothetical protein
MNCPTVEIQNAVEWISSLEELRRKRYMMISKWVLHMMELDDHQFDELARNVEPNRSQPIESNLAASIINAEHRRRQLHRKRLEQVMTTPTITTAELKCMCLNEGITSLTYPNSSIADYPVMRFNDTYVEAGIHYFHERENTTRFRFTTAKIGNEVCCASLQVLFGPTLSRIHVCDCGEDLYQRIFYVTGEIRISDQARYTSTVSLSRCQNCNILLGIRPTREQYTGAVYSTLRRLECGLQEVLAELSTTASGNPTVYSLPYPPRLGENPRRTRQMVPTLDTINEKEGN